jgi:uncharacterized protein (DUF362 family)/NAD-dependent dihydropyrimidine dehydrogenase PreA subunit
VKSSVALVRCESYDQGLVLSAVRRAVGLLGGMGSFVRPDETILVKPNLLAGDPPERATTTHPTVFSAVLQLLIEAGARVEYGDSPGFGGPAAVARKSGIAAAAEHLGVHPGDFSGSVDMPLAEGNAIGSSSIPVARAVLAADGIVSTPKLKTHALVRLTGAVKNQLGCVFGMNKARMDLIAHEARRFAEVLVDINTAVSPRLYVMDAIVCMEGNGPRAGSPRTVGAIIVSTDPVALDATAARLIGLDPAHVPTNVVGAESGHGTFQESEITLHGDSPDELICPDFDVVRSPASHHMLTHLAFMKNLLSPRPVIDQDLCRSCGVCVDACPVPTKAVRFAGEERLSPPVFDYRACIRCFCCQEMCPHQAIEVRTPPLGRIPAIRHRLGHR